MTNGKLIGSRDGAVKEILGAAFILDGPNFLFNPVRKLSPVYAAAELLWYLSGTNSIDMIKYYAPQYERFSNDGVAYGAYGWRWLQDTAWKFEILKVVGEGKVNLPQNYRDGQYMSPLSQLQAAVWLLAQKPDSRQAIVSMWNGGDLAHALAGDKNDLPCTLHLQFIRREKLHMFVSMRSQDIWMGLPYDVWCFSNIQRLVAEALRLEIGLYHHNVGSLHLYERNYEKASKCLVNVSTDDLTYDIHKCGVPFAIQECNEAEPFMRTKTNALSKMSIERLGKGSLLCQCLAMIESKWGRTDHITNKRMKEYIEC